MPTRSITRGQDCCVELNQTQISYIKAALRELEVSPGIPDKEREEIQYLYKHADRLAWNNRY